MKLLLLNENPVVTKLVTLSAQKTGDELVSATNVDDIEEGHYDLLIVDDGSFDESVMENLQAKVTSGKTLFMGSRGSELPSGFEALLSKPFLPTDLVELFAAAAKEVPAESAPAEEVEDTGVFTVEDTFDEDMELAELDDLDDLDSLDDIELGGADEELTLDDDAGSDLEAPAVLDLDTLLDDEVDVEELSMDLDTSDEALELDTLAEGFDLDGVEEETLTDESDQGVLDKDELEEVQSLLDETDADSDESLEIDDLDEIAGLSSSTLEEVNSALDDMDDLFEGEDEEETAPDLTSFDEEENLDDALAELDALSEEPMEESMAEALLEEAPLSDESEELNDDELDALLGAEEELAPEESPSETAGSNATLDEIKAAIAGLSDSSAEEPEAMDVMEGDEALDMDALMEEAASESADEMTEELLAGEEEQLELSDDDMDLESLQDMAEEEEAPEGESEEDALDMEALLEESFEDEEALEELSLESEELADEEMAEEEDVSAGESEEDALDMEALAEESLESEEVPEELSLESEGLGEEEELSADEEDALDIDALLEEGLEEEDALDELALDDEGLDDETGMSELPDDLDALEEEIEHAMESLSEEDLEQAVDEEMLLDIAGADAEAESGGGFDEFDMLNEQALKVALGEAEEEKASDEPRVSVGDSAFASLDAEALDEAMTDTEVASDIASLDTVLQETPEPSASTQEGVEALQSLLKALSNEEVAKSLKGMNININISFGDKD